MSLSAKCYHTVAGSACFDIASNVSIRHVGRATQPMRSHAVRQQESTAVVEGGLDLVPVLHLPPRVFRQRAHVIGILCDRPNQPP